jgi:hypothetical protein
VGATMVVPSMWPMSHEAGAAERSADIDRPLGVVACVEGGEDGAGGARRTGRKQGEGRGAGGGQDEGVK